MDDESTERDSISLSLNLIGLAACVATALASGGLAVIAGAVALACLAGSFAASQMTSESPCERSWRECSEAPATVAAVERGISQGQDGGQSHHWRQSVESSRTACRRR